MKKQKYVILMALSFIFLLVGCGSKALEANEIGKLFINTFVFKKDKTRFEENFVEGELVNKQLTIMTNTFEETFSNVFDTVVEDLSDEEKEKLSSDLMTQVREKSHFTVDATEESKKEVVVTYTIYGLDYADLVEQTLTSLFNELMKETTVTTIDTKRALLHSYEEALVGTKAVNKPVTIDVTFIKNKKQWEIAENQDDKLEKILLAFVSGFGEKEQYEEEMTEMLSRVMTQVAK